MKRNTAADAVCCYIRGSTFPLLGLLFIYTLLYIRIYMCVCISRNLLRQHLWVNVFYDCIYMYVLHIIYIHFTISYFKCYLFSFYIILCTICIIFSSKIISFILSRGLTASVHYTTFALIFENLKVHWQVSYVSVQCMHIYAFILSLTL